MLRRTRALLLPGSSFVTSPINHFLTTFLIKAFCYISGDRARYFFTTRCKPGKRRKPATRSSFSFAAFTLGHADVGRHRSAAIRKKEKIVDRNVAVVA